MSGRGRLCSAAFTFFINTEIADAYRIDSILCLADAKHIGIHLEEEKPDGAVNEAVQQVAFADRILLNKIDLVSDKELEDVVDTMRSINSVAEVIKTTNSVVDLDKILGVSSFSIEKTLEVDPDFLDDEEGHAEAEAVEKAAAEGKEAGYGGSTHTYPHTQLHVSRRLRRRRRLRRLLDTTLFQKAPLTTPTMSGRVEHVCVYTRPRV